MRSAKAIWFVITTVSVLIYYILLQNTQQWNYKILSHSEEVKLLKQIEMLKQQLLEINTHSPLPTDEMTKRILGSELANLTDIVEQYSQAVKTAGFGLIQNLQSFLTNSSSPEIRRRERTELGELVQKRIQNLQNPVDCANARKLLCNVDHPCGFGCIVHHVIYCLMTAYSTNRTLILNLKVRYEGPSWKQMFLPLSNTCQDPHGSSYGTWGRTETNISPQVLIVGTYEEMDIKAPWGELYPARVPWDIISRLERVSSDPVMWWVGQFATYVMRPRQETERMLFNAKAVQKKSFMESSITNTSLIRVGVHVRRTDKLIWEAKSYPLQEYLWHVDEYIGVRVRIDGETHMGHIFLASDEPQVIQKARKLEASSNSTKWKIWANESIAEESKKVNQRFRNGMLPILMDVMLLAECEFVVCTFSSNICRLVAELKEVDPEARGKVVSLDVAFHFIPFMRQIS